MREHVMKMEARGGELLPHEEIYHEMINSASGNAEDDIFLCSALREGF